MWHLTDPWHSWHYINVLVMTIRVPDETGARLRVLAARRGVTLGAVVAELVESRDARAARLEAMGCPPPSDVSWCNHLDPCPGGVHDPAWTPAPSANVVVAPQGGPASVPSPFEPEPELDPELDLSLAARRGAKFAATADRPSASEKAAAEPAPSTDEDLEGSGYERCPHCEEVVAAPYKSKSFDHKPACVHRAPLAGKK